MAQEGKVAEYAFHTSPVPGGCPGLDWHLTLSPDNKLAGIVAWDHGRHVAKLAGELNKDRTLEIRAKEIGGTGRIATVKGTAEGDYVNLTMIDSGSPCDGENLGVSRVAGGRAAAETDGKAGGVHDTLTEERGVAPAEKDVITPHGRKG
jgi:hypothetical protein